MPAPGEHKTVQARILACAQEIGWRYVPRAEAEARRGFDADGATPEERARKGFEDRQTSTAEALAALVREIEKNEQRKKDQTEKGMDGLTYFVLCKLTDDGIANPGVASRKVAAAFSAHPNWRRSEAELREVRKQVTFALIPEEEDFEKVTATVEALFELLQKSFRS